jgi:hypothetical protein
MGKMMGRTNACTNGQAMICTNERPFVIPLRVDMDACFDVS